jgi:hypothetical protein
MLQTDKKKSIIIYIYEHSLYLLKTNRRVFEVEKGFKKT